MTTSNDIHTDCRKIAIIGMAGRFPGADTVGDFWKNILNGVESIQELSDAELEAAGVPPTLINDPLYIKKYARVKGIEQFDAAFFGISPREAELIDPQQRLFLECSWEALEDAGYDPGTYQGSIGVFAGSGVNYYLQRNILVNQDIMNTVDEYVISIGNTSDYLTTRVSYKLNLRGPSINIGTACSTSLVTVQAACLSLSNNLCDMALTGGVSLRIPQTGYHFKEGHILSVDGHCRAFDANANGTVPGEGVGIVLLKRLDDALRDRDNIYAVIASTAINNDGGRKAGFTAPSTPGQATVIKMAHEIANVKPRDISYIETHGTGTVIGDPIEFDGLKKAFNVTGDEEKFCALGAVKTNIGHLDSASGIVGLMKTALALKYRTIPPTLHFTKPNPHINLDRSPFFIPVKTMPWNAPFPRKAGVSSFGIGGTNAHAILEEIAPPVSEPSDTVLHLLPVSARSKNGLVKSLINLSAFLKDYPETNLADASFTLQQGRKSFPYRKAVVCRNVTEAIDALESAAEHVNASENTPPGSGSKCVFMFSGQGTQYAGMTRGLYETEPVFKKAVDTCIDIANPLLDTDLRSILYPSEDKKDQASAFLTETRFTQPALFTIEYALAQLLIDRGINPAAMVGHSLGEYVAACIAGVFSIEDALSLVVNRARIMQEQPAGVMLSVSASEEWLKDNCFPLPEIAVVNAPELCVVGGAEDEIARIEGILADKSIEYRRLRTSHAFHTSRMEGAVEPFKRLCNQTLRKTPTIPLISNLNGTWFTPENATEPSYWSSHLRNTVRFSDGVKQLSAAYPRALIIEIGPGNTLCAICKQHAIAGLNLTTVQTVRGTMQQTDDSTVFLKAVAAIWEAGCSVDWTKSYPSENRHRISLPTYPFDRKRYWIEPVNSSVNNQPTSNNNLSNNPETVAKQPPLPGAFSGDQPVSSCAADFSVANLETYLAELWRKTLGVKSITSNDNYFELGGDSLFAVQIFNDIYQKYKIRLPISVLMEHNTIKAFAGFLYNKVDSNTLKRKNNPGVSIEPEWNTVVAIQPKGDLPPFFCVSGRGGNPMELKKLAAYIGDQQPFYALQFRGVDGVDKPLETIEEMAELFLKDIRKVQAAGPYFLGGYSMGGLVAYEIAQILLKRNDKVAGLVLLDTYNPECEQWTAKERLKNHLLNTLSIGPRYVNARIKAFFNFVIARIKKGKKQAGAFDSCLDLVTSANINAADKYKPLPLGTQVVIVKCTEKLPPLKYGIGFPFHETNGWGQLVAPENLKFLYIPTNHLDVVKEPFVATAAQKFSEGLAILRTQFRQT